MATRFLLFLSLSLALLLPLAPLLAGEDGGEKPLAEKPAADAGDLPGDQKIYVPFKDLKDVFEKEGQGVFVPFDEFMKLWRANLDRRPVPEKPPVPFLVTRAQYEGRVDGDLAVVDATIEFETFTEGWSAVPLGFSGIALGEAKLGDERATLEATAKGYRVLVPEKGAYSLTLSFVTAVGKVEDRRSLGFRLPATPVSRLVFDVPEEGARVTVEPNLATTRTEAGTGVTRVMAYVGAADTVKLSWRPKPAEVKVGPALLVAEAITAASVEEAALRVRADIDYTIHRAPVDRLTVAVPEDARVLFVEGADLRMWDVEKGVLTVSLHKPVEKAYRLSVTLEKDLPASGALAVPEIRAIGVAREQGFVLVRAPKTVKVLPEAERLYRTDFNDVPKEARGGDLILAYRYPAHPWSLSLDITRIQPVVDVAGRTTIHLDERSITVTDQLDFNVTRAPIFSRRLLLPPDVKVVSVSRDTVEDYREVEEDGARHLVLDLKGSRTGAFAVTVVTSRELSVGEQAVDVPLPLLVPEDVRRVEGLVLVTRDEALKIETKDVEGLVPMDARQAGIAAGLAFRYRQAERKGTLVVSRREAEVTALVATTLRAEQNRVAAVSRITWTVRYAGVEEFSFRLPASLMEKVNVTGNNIREKPKTDLGDGTFRQKIVLQGKVTGAYVLVVEYDLPYEELGKEKAKSEDVDVPSLEVDDVKRERGFYAIYRDPAFEVVADSKDLESIDPRELPPGVAQKDVFLAFKYFTHPHSLSLGVEKHDFIEVLQTVVHHMYLVTVLNAQGVSRTGLVLEMTSNGLQFLPVRMPEGAKCEVLVVNGRKINQPQRGADERELLVRMPPEAGPDDRFAVRLVYTVREDVPGLTFHDYEFTAPAIHDGKVPILGTTWYVYPPTDVKITQAGGTLRRLDVRDSWWANVVRDAPLIFRSSRPGGYVRAGGARTHEDLADLVPSGQRALVFSGRSQAPEVSVAYADAGTFTFLLVLVFVVFLGGGVFLFRESPRAWRVRYVLACVAAPLLLVPIAAPGLAEILTAALLGGLAAGLWWCASSVVPTAWERVNGWRDRRRHAAEPAPVEPSPAEVELEPEEGETGDQGEGEEE